MSNGKNADSTKSSENSFFSTYSNESLRKRTIKCSAIKSSHKLCSCTKRKTFYDVVNEIMATQITSDNKISPFLTEVLRKKASDIRQRAAANKSSSRQLPFIPLETIQENIPITVIYNKKERRQEATRRICSKPILKNTIEEIVNRRCASNSIYLPTLLRKKAGEDITERNLSQDSNRSRSYRRRLNVPPLSIPVGGHKCAAILATECTEQCAANQEELARKAKLRASRCMAEGSGVKCNAGVSDDDFEKYVDDNGIIRKISRNVSFDENEEYCKANGAVKRNIGISDDDFDQCIDKSGNVRPSAVIEDRVKHKRSLGVDDADFEKDECKARCNVAICNEPCGDTLPCTNPDCWKRKRKKKTKVVCTDCGIQTVQPTKKHKKCFGMCHKSHQQKREYETNIKTCSCKTCKCFYCLDPTCRMNKPKQKRATPADADCRFKPKEKSCKGACSECSKKCRAMEHKNKLPCDCIQCICPNCGDPNFGKFTKSDLELQPKSKQQDESETKSVTEEPDTKAEPETETEPETTPKFDTEAKTETELEPKVEPEVESFNDIACPCFAIFQNSRRPIFNCTCPRIAQGQVCGTQNPNLRLCCICPTKDDPAAVVKKEPEVQLEQKPGETTEETETEPETEIEPENTTDPEVETEPEVEAEPNVESEPEAETETEPETEVEHVGKIESAPEEGTDTVTEPEVVENEEDHQLEEKDASKSKSGQKICIRPCQICPAVVKAIEKLTCLPKKRTTCSATTTQTIESEIITCIIIKPATRIPTVPTQTRMLSCTLIRPMTCTPTTSLQTELETMPCDLSRAMTCTPSASLPTNSQTATCALRRPTTCIPTAPTESRMQTCIIRKPTTCTPGTATCELRRPTTCSPAAALPTDLRTTTCVLKKSTTCTPAFQETCEINNIANEPKPTITTCNLERESEIKSTTDKSTQRKNRHKSDKLKKKSHRHSSSEYAGKCRAMHPKRRLCCNCKECLCPNCKDTNVLKQSLNSIAKEEILEQVCPCYTDNHRNENPGKQPPIIDCSTCTCTRVEKLTENKPASNTVQEQKIPDVCSSYYDCQSYICPFSNELAEGQTQPNGEERHDNQPNSKPMENSKLREELMISESDLFTENEYFYAPIPHISSSIVGQLHETNPTLYNESYFYPSLEVSEAQSNLESEIPIPEPIFANCEKSKIVSKEDICNKNRCLFIWHPKEGLIEDIVNFTDNSQINSMITD